jgi:hypothetical protein
MSREHHYDACINGFEPPEFPDDVTRKLSECFRLSRVILHAVIPQILENVKNFISYEQTPTTSDGYTWCGCINLGIREFVPNGGKPIINIKILIPWIKQPQKDGTGDERSFAIYRTRDVCDNHFDQIIEEVIDVLVTSGPYPNLIN